MSQNNQLSLLYEGKAKIIYQTEQSDQLIQYFKDEATAFNAEKKAVLSEKGILNNYISAAIMEYLAASGIKTHFIKRLDQRRQFIKRLTIIPIEVIIRNYAAGSLVKRLAFTEGALLTPPICEFCYKNDALKDPLINHDHMIALKIANSAQIAYIKEQALKINQHLINFFAQAGINLIDFKLEFGLDQKQQIILADDISPDSARLWDNQTKQKMDKDRFRQDLGNVVAFYREVAKRLQINFNQSKDEKA